MATAASTRGVSDELTGGNEIRDRVAHYRGFKRLAALPVGAGFWRQSGNQFRLCDGILFVENLEYPSLGKLHPARSGHDLFAYFVLRFT